MCQCVHFLSLSSYWGLFQALSQFTRELFQALSNLATRGAAKSLASFSSFSPEIRWVCRNCRNLVRVDRLPFFWLVLRNWQSLHHHRHTALHLVLLSCYSSELALSFFGFKSLLLFVKYTCDFCDSAISGLLTILWKKLYRKSPQVNKYLEEKYLHKAFPQLIVLSLCRQTAVRLLQFVCADSWNILYSSLKISSMASSLFSVLIFVAFVLRLYHLILVLVIVSISPLFC